MNTDFHLGPPAQTNAGPLTGVSILITRPVMPASRTATRLAALGATPLIFPTLPRWGRELPTDACQSTQTRNYPIRALRL